MWWPGLDSDIEAMANSCPECQSSPPVAPLYPWKWPSWVYQRVDIDFAGPFQGTNFLVAVDAYSKWSHVVMMQSTTVDKTIDALRQMLSMNGLPEHIVTDNGSQFTSAPDPYVSTVDTTGRQPPEPPWFLCHCSLLKYIFVVTFKGTNITIPTEGTWLFNHITTIKVNRSRLHDLKEGWSSHPALRGIRLHLKAIHHLNCIWKLSKL